MTGFTYLGALVLSIAAMALIDVRWRLAFRRAPAASALAVGAGTLVLLAWDLAGIGFGVFFRGDSPWATGMLLAPELPLEEPVFLVFLCYLSLVAVLGVERMLERRSTAQGERAASDATTDAATRPGATDAATRPADAAAHPGGRPS
ncbi:MAG TPA: lycopene cyclase domain-containing protein [Agromyces mariniharenae]|nr:lycopene cyclase domain-containing protein [Agromyces mariniharenae]